MPTLQVVIPSDLDLIFDIGVMIPNKITVKDCSATERGVVNNVAGQELGGVDKQINGVDIGKGGGLVATNTRVGDDAGLNWTAANPDMTALGYRAGRDVSSAASYGATLIGSNAGRAASGGIATFIGYNAGQTATGDNNTAVGGFAMGGMAASVRNTAVGSGALQTAVGNDNTVSGYNAGQVLTGGGNVAIGVGALSNAVGTVNFSTAVGYNAGRLLAGNDSTVIGSYAAQSSTAPGSVAIGHSAMLNATGSLAVVIGNASGSRANGAYQTMVGSGCGAYAQGDNIILLGQQAGQMTNGLGVVSIGYRAGRNNNAARNTFLGYQAGYAVALAPAIAVTAIDPVLDQITVAGHGVPVGVRAEIFVPTGGTYPAPLAGGQYYVVVAIDANTLQFVGTDITGAAGAFSIQVNAPTTFSNATAVGSNSLPTASNQVMLGDSAVTEVRSTGAFFGAAFNIVSDKRNKRNIADIDLKQAVEFSKAVKFHTFTLLQSYATLEQRFAADVGAYEYDRTVLEAELEAAKNAGPDEEHRTIGDIQKDLKALVAPVSPVQADMRAAAGVIAQELLEVTKALGAFEWLVEESGTGELTVDYTSLFAVISAGFQARLAAAGF